MFFKCYWFNKRLIFFLITTLILIQFFNPFYIILGKTENSLKRSNNQITNPDFGSIISNFGDLPEDPEIVAISPDGKILASSYWNNIKLWNLTSRTEIATLSGHSDLIRTLIFSPDGSMLVSGCQDDTIKFWSMVSKSEVKTLKEEGVFSIVFSPDHRTFASTAYDYTIHLWDSYSGTLSSLITLSSYSWIGAIDFSPDGSIIASGASDGQIRLWNIATGTEIISLPASDDYISDLVFLADGKIIASVGHFKDPIIKLWNVSTGSEIGTLTGHSDGVNTLAYSEITKILASGSRDNSIKLWNITSLTEIKTLTGHNDHVNDLTFSSDGSILASAGLDYTVKLWNVVNIANDSDFDGLPDSWEDNYGLDKANYWDKFDDLDQDGLMNYMEHFLSYNPTENDVDGDLMPDGWEYLMGLNLTLADGNEDKDGDNLSNFNEYLYQTNPNKVDSDYDTITDNIEIQSEILNPNVNDGKVDTDGDWISNLDEYKAGTDPNSLMSFPISRFTFVHLLTILFLFLIIVIVIVILIGFYYYKSYQRKKIIVQYGAPNYSIVKKIKAGQFTNYAIFKQAQDVGASTLAEYQIVQLTKSPDFQTALKVQEKGYTNYDLYLKAKKSEERRNKMSKLMHRTDRISKSEFMDFLEFEEHSLFLEFITSLPEDSPIFLDGDTVVLKKEDLDEEATLDAIDKLLEAFETEEKYKK
ncbi:MAG: hypothetical protein ACXAC7_18280 [Candidatus Hodarchaeales archaeon]|jgi:WD40 repeat protein